MASGNDSPELTHRSRPGARPAPPPANEPRRLAALRQYQILDTPPEEAFDDIVRLAATVCQTPFALLSLVDADRQWFKARVGIAEQETPRAVSFCAHAILHPEQITVIPDAALDERFFASDLVVGAPHVRCYAGAPLVVGDGLALGTLCVYDTVPRTLSAEQLAALDALRRTAVRQIELRRAAAESSAHNAVLHHQNGLIDHIPDAIIVSDPEFVIQSWNRGAEVIYGWRAEEVVGRPLSDVISTTFPAGELGQVLASFFAAGSWKGEVVQRRRDGAPVHILSAVTLIRDRRGGPVAVVAVNRDIDDLKAAQLQLLELNQTLEARVRERTAEVRDLYEHAPTGYHTLDAAGRILMINQTELSWLGYSRDELVGRPFAEIVAERSAPGLQESLRCLRELGAVRDIEQELIRKDGSSFPALLNAAAIYDRDGGFVMGRCTVFDNTERKQAEDALRESEAQNRLLFEEAPDAIVLLDDKSTLVRVNHAFELLTGRGREDVEGREIDDLGLVPPGLLDRLREEVGQNFQSSHVTTVELQLACAGGVVRDVGVRVFALTFRGRQHSLCAIRDISAYKEAERALLVANQEMGRALRTRDEFLANMSHELRTPLNAILGLSEILQEGVYGQLSARQGEALRSIEASGQHLLALINDILDVSKIEADRLALRVDPFVVSDICYASLQFVREQAARKGQLLSFQIDDQEAMMLADAKRLKQMLVNLLSNAVKFTPPGGQVSLEVELRPAEALICFTVRDTGIGIAPEDVARLFQPFVQLDSSLSRQHEGTGLGLVLVRRLAELHGGAVAVESRLGAGSSFTVSLPYQSPDAGPPEPAVSAYHEGGAPAAPPAPARRVLLVEDNEVNIELVAGYLQGKGFSVAEARTGREAIERAGSFQPQVILMDIQMPEMDGLEAIRSLRATTAPATPIIALTALAMPGDRERCLAAGASEYLPKPVSLRQLTGTIVSLLEQAKSLAAGPAAGGRDR